MYIMLEQDNTFHGAYRTAKAAFDAVDDQYPGSMWTKRICYVPALKLHTISICVKECNTLTHVLLISQVTVNE